MGSMTASLHEGEKVTDSQKSYILSNEQTELIQEGGLRGYSEPRLVQQQNFKIFATLFFSSVMENQTL